MIALIAGLIYLQQKNDQDSIQNFSGAIFFTITFSSFNSLTSALFVSKLRFFSCISVTVRYFIYPLTYIQSRKMFSPRFAASLFRGISALRKIITSAGA